MIVVLDNVRSAQNVGAFFRTADAFGIERIYLCGICAVPPHRDVHKTALGAELTVPWRHFQTTAEALEDLRSEGHTIIAVEQTPNSIPLQDWREGSEKMAFVFGNEVDGVGAEVLEMADDIVEIPQVGQKKSLNVAVAGGVVLWHANHLKNVCRE